MSACSRQLCTLSLVLGGLLLAAPFARGQISYTGGVVFQDFNTLPGAGVFTFTTKGPQALDQTPVNAAGAGGWSMGIGNYKQRIGMNGGTETSDANGNFSSSWFM